MMILLSPAKVNIGLQITGKRSDGFHDLRSLMFPVGLCDILEIRSLEGEIPGIRFTSTGKHVDGESGTNLCEQAYMLMSSKVPLPPVHIHLHKSIPVGAGLGGGSSNASATLLGLNRLTRTPLSDARLHELAARLGSDCPFFLHRTPMLMEGRGEILNPWPLDPGRLFLVILFPEVHISTAEAYSNVVPRKPEQKLEHWLARTPERWKEGIANDFETSIFRSHPGLGKLKEGLYGAGAIYASMSGSGSAFFALFKQRPVLPPALRKYQVWSGMAGKLPELT
jgi:4-diphosphocytidyl-2-C-methyl-D-erythritol kinase